MTFEEIAKQYAEIILQATDKRKAAIDVQNQLDSLIYSTSSKSLSLGDKIEILQLVKIELESQKRKLLENRNFSQQMHKVAAASNDEAIKAISSIIEMMRGLR